MTRSQIVPSSHSRVHGHRPRRVMAFAALLTAMQLGLVGCRSASPSANGSSATHPASAATSNTRSRTPTLPTPAQLKAALLTAADLGTGFASSAVGSLNADGTSVRGCPALAAVLAGPPSAGQTSQQADLSAGAPGPYVEESLTTGPAAALDADYAQTKAALTSCTVVSITINGVAVDFKLTSVQSGDPGAVAVRMDATADRIQLFGYFATERLGSVFLEFFYFEFENASTKTAYSYYSHAVTKARSVLGAAAA